MREAGETEDVLAAREKADRLLLEMVDRFLPQFREVVREYLRVAR
jgi:hypothetical protein